MRVVTLEDRNGVTSTIIARFALDGEQLDEPGPSAKPNLSELVDIRKALGDFIKIEKEKADAAWKKAEAESRRDAELISGVVSSEQVALAAAEAHEAHVAAMKAKAEEAVAEAKEKVKKVKT